MIQTILGVVLYSVPFILIFSFRDKIRGLVYVSTCAVVVHLLIALITQYFHIFSYGVVAGIHAIIAIACMTFFVRREKFFDGIRFSWLFLSMMVLVGTQLASVHYFYKGIVSDIGGLNAVSRDFYPYPHYSDEWVGVSFAKYAIREQSLPLVNSLWQNEPFANGLVVFYSLISEFFVLLNVAPLFGWSLFAVVNGLMISFLIFVFLKSSNVSTFSAVIAGSAVPLIVNGVNVAGVWFLIPHIFAVTIFLLSLIAFNLKESKAGFIASMASVLLYPPLIALVAPTLCVYVVRNGIPKFYLLSVAGVGVVMALLLSAVTGFAQAFSLLLSWITRENLDGGIASLPIWLVIPFLLLPFIFFGLYLLFKNKSYGVLTPIVIGLILWCVYSVVGSVIVIDKSRIVSITTILLMIPLGFGIEYVVNWIKDTRYIPHSSRVALLFKGALLVTFALGAFFYPTSNTWSYFQLNIETEQGMQKFPPSAPITRFLHEDDLIFFSGFSGKVFIAPPWKGLVIGSATGNFPLDTKASTLTNRYVLYSDFMELSCEEKSIVANEYTIEYVYGTRFACEAFEELGRSVENLYMYKYVSKQNEG